MNRMKAADVTRLRYLFDMHVYFITILLLKPRIDFSRSNHQWGEIRNQWHCSALPLHPRIQHASVDWRTTLEQEHAQYDHATAVEVDILLLGCTVHNHEQVQPHSSRHVQSMQDVRVGGVLVEGDSHVLWALGRISNSATLTALPPWTGRSSEA